MDRGTYAAASAGVANLLKMQVVSNNLANVNTPGFKREFLVGESQSFNQTLAAQELQSGVTTDPYAQGDHDRVMGAVTVRSVTDFTPGPIKTTGNSLDVALQNDKDFFVVVGAQGTAQYTRSGAFSIDSAGNLVTGDGLAVQGDGGAINIPEGGKVRITESGEVFAGDQILGRLQVARFEDPSSLVRVEGTRFQLGSGTPAPEFVEAQVVPNSLEMANVSVVSNIVELMTTSRGFESYVKVAQSIDEINRIAINDIVKG
jgi:flagellar basal-body rod protein FlgG